MTYSFPGRGRRLEGGSMGNCRLQIGDLTDRRIWESGKHSIVMGDYR